MTESAGILVYRQQDGLEVLLGHPGGPFWARKDEGAWSIPKGEVEAGEDPEETARREFSEETGQPPPSARLLDLGSIKQKSGKGVHAWAMAGDYDTESLVANDFEMEWPPRSGKTAAFPEVDRYQWFDLGTARRKLNPAQTDLIDRLESALRGT